jgi:uncharacterized phiE125 gp8 family phage protein
MYSRVIVAPPVEPLTLAEVRLDRAVEHSLHDAMLSAMIVAARQYVERYCQISIVTQTREAGFDGFDAPQIELPYGPVQSVISLEYVGADGTATAISDYQSNLFGASPVLMPAYGQAWPALTANLNAVTVRYVAGYEPVAGSPTDYTSNVPEALKIAMRLLVGNWYENREATVTGAVSGTLELGVHSLLEIFRLRKGMA